MAKFLILGAGKFGRLALARLAARDEAASFLMVDRAPEALAAAVGGWQNGHLALMASEAALFLARNLREGAPWDWIIPMLPVHVTFAWLTAGPLAEGPWRPVEVPEALESLVPVARRGPLGELYLSRARHLCPDDCEEPESVCPISGETREVPLYQELADLKVPGWQVRIIPSRQLAPGVGGYPPRRLLDLARDLVSLEGKILVATACCCHGVVHGLERVPERKGV